MNGRAALPPLARVIAEICARAGLIDVDVTRAYGLVRGFALTGTESSRAALQGLLLAHSIDATEREDRLSFRRRDAWNSAHLDVGRLAVISDLDGVIETSRAADAETLGRLRITFVEAESDFSVRTAEAIFPDDSSAFVSDSDLPMVLTATEARDMAERWLAESRVARDSARFALPLSAIALGSGDTVQIGPLRYRIDRVEQAESLLVEAVRVDAASYLRGAEVTDRPTERAYLPPLPVYSLLLDLPLLAGDEVPHAPHVAITASPWPGSVAVWSSATDEGYTLNRVIEERAVVGVTESELQTGPIGVWDRGPALRVRLLTGELASADPFAVLNGANVAAIGDGVTDAWEVFQFADAELVSPATYELRMRLRGQAGTDFTAAQIWPIGSRVVLLNSAVQQLNLTLGARGLSRFYRIGAASRGYDDRNVTVLERAFSGNGLRPYRVAHLTATGGPGQNIAVNWIRRTRIDGDSWQSTEVPLGEDRESYLLRVTQGTATLREVILPSPDWVYTAAQQTADAATTPFQISVAQISNRYGPGPFRSVTFG